MRRRYGGKRRLRMRKRRGRKRRSVIPQVDHCSSGARFNKAIAKGISRKAYATTTVVRSGYITGNSGSQVAVSEDFFVPFHLLLPGFGKRGDNNRTNALIPLFFMQGSPLQSADFLRHANMYRQYRIKCIRFEFVPNNAVTGKESILSVYPGEPRPGPSSDEVAGLMDRTTIGAAMQWWIKWPNKNGTFGDWGVNMAGSGNTGANTNITTVAGLYDPTVIKVPISEKLVLFWRPKVMGSKVLNWQPLNVAGTSGEISQSFAKSYAKPFPWTYIIDNVEQGHSVNESAEWTGQQPAVPVNPAGGATYNTTGIRQPMTQPAIAVYNQAQNIFMPQDELAPYINGRWTMHVVFEFKQKYKNTAINPIPAGALTEANTNLLDVNIDAH